VPKVLVSLCSSFYPNSQFLNSSIRNLVLHRRFRMEHVDLFEIISQIFPFIGSQNAKGQADQGPQVDDLIVGAVMFAEFMDLGMAVVAPGNTIGGTGFLDLIVFQFAILQTLLFEPGLQKTAPAPATVVVRAVGLHVDEILFTHDRFDNEAQVLSDGIAIALAHDLAWILNRKLDLQVLVPVGIDLQFALTDPPGVVFIDVLDFEVVFEVEFFQSCQD